MTTNWLDRIVMPALQRIEHSLGDSRGARAVSIKYFNGRLGGGGVFDGRPGGNHVERISQNV